MRRRAGVALAPLLAGLLLAASLAPWGLWPLAFVGAALLYRCLDGRSLWGRLVSGWLAGLGCFVPGLWWAAHFNWYGAAVLMVVESLSMALAAAVCVPPIGVVAFTGAFTLAEWVRSTWPFGGLPLGGVFLGQAQGPLLATARLGGPLLLTALVWLGGAGLGVLWGRRPLRAGAAIAPAAPRERLWALAASAQFRSGIRGSLHCNE